MSTLSPDWWQAVSPYLDQALEMPDEERAAWLASLREQNPVLAAHLQNTARRAPHARRKRVSSNKLQSRCLAQSALAGQPIGAYTLHVADRSGRNGQRLAR